MLILACSRPTGAGAASARPRRRGTGPYQALRAAKILRLGCFIVRGMLPPTVMTCSRAPSGSLLFHKHKAQGKVNRKPTIRACRPRRVAACRQPGAAGD